jgi:hypothetical protein
MFCLQQKVKTFPWRYQTLPLPIGQKPSHDPHELNAGEMTKTWDSDGRHKSSSNEELHPHTQVTGFLAFL